MKEPRITGIPTWNTETEYYERYADVYFPILPFFHHGIVGNSPAEFLQHILGKLRLTSKSRVVDLGCGSGYFVNEVTSRGSRAVGISTSAACIRGCKERYPNAMFELANMEAYIKPGATHVTAMESLGYANIEKTFSCVAQSLSPGGIFYVNDVFQKTIIETPEQLENRKYFEYYWKYKARRVDEFVALAYRSGFELSEFNDLRSRANSEILLRICEEHDEVPYRSPYPELGSPTYPVEFIFTRRKD